MNVYKYFSFILFFASTGVLVAQSSVDNHENIITAQSVDRLLLHYSQQEIDEIREYDNLKYQSVLYYYYHSFTLEFIECNDCIPFDTKTFDISRYEKYRKKSEPSLFKDVKRGIIVHLTPVEQMTFKLPIHLYLH